VTAITAAITRNKNAIIKTRMNGFAGSSRSRGWHERLPSLSEGAGRRATMPIRDDQRDAFPDAALGNLVA